MEDYDEYYCFIEKIWTQILIFTSNLIEIYIFPNKKQDENVIDKQEWVTNLIKCLSIMLSCYN